MAKIDINHDKCEGSECGECADICPMEILVLEGDKILIQNEEYCTLCEVCMDTCPQQCINVEDVD